MGMPTRRPELYVQANKLPGRGEGQYVYRLRDPITHLVRYIGSTCQPRARYVMHCCWSSRCRTREWIDGLVDLGHYPIPEIVFGPDLGDGMSAYIVENVLISRYRSQYPGQLLNSTFSEWCVRST